MTAQTEKRFKPWDDETAQQIAADNRDRPGALMPILTGLLENFGYINPDFVPHLADLLNLSRAEVHGVISFYHDFRTTPPGETVVKLCRAEACQAMGGAKLAEHAKQTLGVDFHGTTADGRYSLEQVFCLGNCACAPAVMLDETLYGRVTPERFDTVLKKYKGAA